jgi:hypothetical protein
VSHGASIGPDRTGTPFETWIVRSTTRAIVDTAVDVDDTDQTALTI